MRRKLFLFISVFTLSVVTFSCVKERDYAEVNLTMSIDSIYVSTTSSNSYDVVVTVTRNVEQGFVVEHQGVVYHETEGYASLAPDGAGDYYYANGNVHQNLNTSEEVFSLTITNLYSYTGTIYMRPFVVIDGYNYEGELQVIYM